MYTLTLPPKAIAYNLHDILSARTWALFESRCGDGCEILSLQVEAMSIEDEVDNFPHVMQYCENLQRAECVHCSIKSVTNRAAQREQPLDEKKARELENAWRSRLKRGLLIPNLRPNCISDEKVAHEIFVSKNYRYGAERGPFRIRRGDIVLSGGTNFGGFEIEAFDAGA